MLKTQGHKILSEDFLSQQNCQEVVGFSCSGQENFWR